MPVMPWFTPVATSVYSRSPTIAISSSAKPVRRSASSTMPLYGLPRITSAFRPVLASMNAMIAPMSGIKPVSVGQLKSGCVAMYGLP